MIIEEGTEITLANGGRYYLVHEIGELEGYEGNYFFAAGITKNEKINTNDIAFIRITNNDGKTMAKKIGKNNEIYALLSSLEITSVLMESIPGFKDRLIADLPKLDKIAQLEESSQ